MIFKNCRIHIKQGRKGKSLPKKEWSLNYIKKGKNRKRRWQEGFLNIWMKRLCIFPGPPPHTQTTIFKFKMKKKEYEEEKDNDDEDDEGKVWVYNLPFTQSLRVSYHLLPFVFPNKQPVRYVGLGELLCKNSSDRTVTNPRSPSCCMWRSG